MRALTIVGGVREALLVWLRGRWKTVCARVAWPAWVPGPSTSPLGVMRQVEQQLPTETSIQARFIRRRTVIWTHAVAAIVTAFVYLSDVNLGRLAYGGSRGGLAIILAATPVLLPYAISAGHCWRLDTWDQSGPSRLRVGAFVALVAIGAVLLNAALLGAFGRIGGAGLFGLLALQAFAYLWGAEWILEVT